MSYTPIEIPSICPNCNDKSDLVSSLDDRDVPVNGDVSICFSCGGIGIFDDKEKGGIRLPTSQEIITNTQDKKLQEYIKTIKEAIMNKETPKETDPIGEAIGIKSSEFRSKSSDLGKKLLKTLLEYFGNDEVKTKTDGGASLNINEMLIAAYTFDSMSRFFIKTIESANDDADEIDDVNNMLNNIIKRAKANEQ